VRRLEDIEAVKQLKYRYAAFCDQDYDPDGLAPLFTENAIWDGGIMGRYEGRDAIRTPYDAGWARRRMMELTHNA